MATGTIKVTELCKTESPSLMDFDEVELAEILLSLGRGCRPINTNVVGSDPGVPIHEDRAIPVPSQTGTDIRPPYHCVYPEESEGEDILRIALTLDLHWG